MKLIYAEHENGQDFFAPEYTAYIDAVENKTTFCLAKYGDRFDAVFIEVDRASGRCYRAIRFPAASQDYVTHIYLFDAQTPVDFSELAGKTLIGATNLNNGKVLFFTDEEELFILGCHDEGDDGQAVHIEEMSGDLSALLDSQLLTAEEEPREGHAGAVQTVHKLETREDAVLVVWHRGFYDESPAVSLRQAA